MTALTDYLLFFSKTITIVLAILIVCISLIAAKSKSKKPNIGKLNIKKLNTHYEELAQRLNAVIQTKAERKAAKQHTKQLKKNNKQSDQAASEKPKCFVFSFQGDVRASAVETLRETITAILLVAKQGDRALCQLESPGGMVNAYGLAASQLQRLRDADIHLTVAVDKVAASGGYLMACVANTILAAPFAIIGSIGVVLQLPNFHRLLTKNNVDIELLTAGKHKRTLTTLGKNTAEGREKMQSDLNETHTLFKDYIHTHRPQVALDEVATGEYWYGTQAMTLSLVDRLQTSDDFLLSEQSNYDIYRLSMPQKKRLTQRLIQSSQDLIDTLSIQR